MSDVQANYEELKKISTRFRRQHQEIGQMNRKVRTSMHDLHDDWIGRGSRAFFNEMRDEVLPATKRLQEALEEAAKITQKIAKVMKQAEEEAANPFRNWQS